MSCTCRVSTARRRGSIPGGWIEPRRAAALGGSVREHHPCRAHLAGTDVVGTRGVDVVDVLHLAGRVGKHEVALSADAGSGDDGNAEQGSHDDLPGRTRCGTWWRAALFTSD